MNSDILNQITTIVEALSALAVATGFVPAAIRFFQARGVDINAVRNSTLVRVAEAAGLASLRRLQTNGANLEDPTVVEAAVRSVVTSLQTSHAETLASLGASAADVQRVANDGTQAAMLRIKASTAAIAAAPATPAVPALSLVPPALSAKTP